MHEPERSNSNYYLFGDAALSVEAREATGVPSVVNMQPLPALFSGYRKIFPRIDASPTTPRGSPCCARFPGVHAAATPRRSDWRHYLAHPSSRDRLPRYDSRVVLRIELFEDCSAFTHVAACTHALPPIRGTLTRRLQTFVTSMPTPAASGWSGCRAGIAPAGKTPPFHGARRKRQFVPPSATAAIRLFCLR